MDPNNSQVPLTNPDLQKLEDDLKNLQSTPSNPTTLPVQPIQPIESFQSAPEVPVQNEMDIDSNEPIGSLTSPKKSPVVLIAVILLLIAVASVAAYFLIPKYVGNLGGYTACTTEAKICPDGSSVGRSGPNCEFEACPAYVPVSTLIPTPEVTPGATVSGTVKPTSTPTSSPSALPSI